jgi:hypothetical protein
MGSFKVSRTEPSTIRGLVMLALQLHDLVEFGRLISEDPDNWRFVAIDLKLDLPLTALAVSSAVGLICWATGISGGGRRGSAIS